MTREQGDALIYMFRAVLWAWLLFLVAGVLMYVGVLWGLAVTVALVGVLAVVLAATHQPAQPPKLKPLKLDD